MTMKFGIDRLLADPALRAPLTGKRVALLALAVGLGDRQAFLQEVRDLRARRRRNRWLVPHDRQRIECRERTVAVDIERVDRISPQSGEQIARF